MTTDFQKALAATRELHHDPEVTYSAYWFNEYQSRMGDLLAAIDAQPIAGEVWQYRANSTSRGKEWIDCRDERIARDMEALGFEIRCLYAAPPAAPRVERHGDGVLVHWPEGVEQYIAVGDCVTAPPAAAVKNREPNRIGLASQCYDSAQLSTLPSWCRELLESAADALCEAPPAPAVPEFIEAWRQESERAGTCAWGDGYIAGVRRCLRDYHAALAAAQEGK